MSRKARRRPGSSKSDQGLAEGRAGCAAGAALVFGLGLACLGVFLFPETSRIFRLWRQRGDYLRTELKVTEIGHEDLGGGAIVFGTVAATGDEVRCTRLPAELREFSASDPNSKVMTFEKVSGKVVPIWYARNHTSFFSSDPVQYVSEFATLPSGKLALGIAAVNFAILAAGVGLVVFGARRINALTAGTGPS